MSLTCLLVDDDETLRVRLAKALAARGLRVTAAANYDEAMAAAREFAFDWSVLDLKMPGKNGMELLRDLKRLRPTIRAIILTGYGSIANAVEALHAGAENYVTKPADADDIVAAIQKFTAADPSEPSSIPDVRGSTPLAAPVKTEPHSPSLAEAEWDHIQRVLSDCRGNISEAARVLDIPRRTLQRKLKKLAP